MIVAFSGLILLSAVSAYAERPLNGLPLNGIPLNGLPINGMPMNGLAFNGNSFNGRTAQGLQYRDESLPSVQSENLPWSTLSHKGLGKSSH